LIDLSNHDPKPGNKVSGQLATALLPDEGTGGFGSAIGFFFRIRLIYPAGDG